MKAEFVVPLVVYVVQ